MLEPHVSLRDLAHSMRSLGDEKQQVEIRYIESEMQKGNIYTKALVPAQFCADCDLRHVECKDPATTATIASVMI